MCWPPKRASRRRPSSRPTCCSPTSVRALDLYKELDPLDPIDLKFLVTVALLGFLADEGFALPDGAGFIGINPVTGVAELVLVGLALLFLGSSRTVTLNRFTLTGIDTRQGLSVRGDSSGNYAILVFATALALIHFAYMKPGEHMQVSLALGIPQDVLWTPAGVYILVRNQNGLVFVPKFGSPTLRTLPFSPLHAVIGPNGHFYISDYNTLFIHELTSLFLEVALFPVKAQAYGLAFLPTGELLFAYLPNIFAILDLATRIETNYTLAGNRQLLDYWIRPGYFPPRILVDEFDTVSRKGLVVELTILGLLANPYVFCRPVLKHQPLAYNAQF